MSESLQQIMVNVAVFLIIAALVVVGRWIRRILHQLDEVHTIAGDVNRAVNNHPEGDPKLYDMVKDAAQQAILNGETADRLEVQFADHSRSDEINFADIRSRLAHLPQAGGVPFPPETS